MNRQFIKKKQNYKWAINLRVINILQLKWQEDRFFHNVYCLIFEGLLISKLMCKKMGTFFSVHEYNQLMFGWGQFENKFMSLLQYPYNE